MRHRQDGTSAPGPDFGRFLHQELHAAADQVDPHPDGLERIRTRVEAAHASRANAGPASSGLLADMVRRWNARRGGLGAGHVRRGVQQGWRAALIRPAIALACAVFAVGVVLASVPPLRQAVSSSV